MVEFANLVNVRPWEWEQLSLVDTYVLMANVDGLRRERQKNA